MTREFAFYGSACSRCEKEVREGQREYAEVIWHINCYMNGGQRKRAAGWMTEEEIRAYEAQGRVHKSNSSTHCPPCTLKVLSLPSIEALQETWRSLEFPAADKEVIKEIHKALLLGFRQYEMFLKK